MNKLTMGSLFDGIGGFVYAGNQVDIKTLWSSEIDPACEAVTKHHFPEVEQLGDITKIDGAKVDPVYIICGGSPCFPKGTLVLTETGYVPIENISENDKVLTHTGKWQRVLRYGSKIADTIVLKGQGHYGIECTPEHPFYASEKYQTWCTSESRSANSRSPVRHLSSPSWTQAKDMVGKMWATPIQLEGTQIPPIEKKSAFCKEPPRINKDFWWLVGRWLGDGWTLNNQRNDRRVGCTRGEVFIACGNYRKDGLKEKLDKVIPNWYECDNDGHSCKYRNTHVGFADWLDAHFGKYAHGKKIPSFCFSMKDIFRQALLDGICSADGYAFNEHTHKITTVSKELAIGIRLLAEGLGYSTALHKVETKPTCIIEGRVCSQRDQYQVALRLGNRSCGMRANAHSWYSVKEIKQGKHNIRVYNLEVEHDNSYVVENIVVHNCQDLSVAGKRAGLAGERSGLYMEQIRIIREMRAATDNTYPRYMVWENVPGALSSNKGDDFRAVLEEAARCADEAVSIPESKKWSNAGCIVGDGWSIAWRILDAQFWGVPQRRRRIFLVADFGSERAGGILFKPEGVRGNPAESGDAREGATADVVGCAGRGGGGSLYGFDGYNGTLTGDKSATIGINCGTSTGRNGIVERSVGGSNYTKCFAIDALSSNSMKSKNPHSGFHEEDYVKCLNPHDTQSQRIYDANGIYPCLSSNETGGQNRQAILLESKCAGFNGWKSVTGTIQYQDECAPTLEANMPANVVGVGAFMAGQGAKARTIGYSEESAPTLKSTNSGGNTVPTVVYGVDCRNVTLDAEKTHTIQAHSAGGISLNCTPSVCYASTGYGKFIEGCPTLRASGGDCGGGSEALVMATGQANAEIACGISTTLLAESHEQPICVHPQIAGTLCASGAGMNRPAGQGNETDMCIVTKSKKNRKYIIRRLTPLECEKLQGFPSNWTQVTYKNKPMSDSARYRMCGNSVAIPCVVRVLGGIVESSK